MSDFPRVHRPCDECPWRRDALPGRFPAERWEALASTSPGPGGASVPLGSQMFACHKTPEGGDRACASWLAVAGGDHIGVRLAVVMGRLDPAALTRKPEWPPLFGSYAELVASQRYGGDPVMTETVDSRTLWQHARVGDRLPPADWPCGAEHPDRTWVCHRANDHDGTRHVATVACEVRGTAAVEVVAVWDAPGIRLPSLDAALRGRAAGVLGHPAMRRPA